MVWWWQRNVLYSLCLITATRSEGSIGEGIVDLGLEEGYEAGFAVLGPDDERSIGVEKGTWCRWHA